MPFARAFACALLSIPLSALPQITAVRISQVDYYSAGTLVKAHSATGRLDVAFTQDPQGVSFLNVVQMTANGNVWLVANVPLVSTAETGTTNFSVNKYFNLMVADGTNLAGSTIDYYYTVSADLQTSIPAMPPGAGGGGTFAPPGGGGGTAPVGSVARDDATGIKPMPAVSTDPPPGAGVSLPRAVSVKQIWHQHTGNVASPTNYCAPAAAANSLQFLAANNGYTLKDSPAQARDNLAKMMGTNSSNGGTTEQGAASGLAGYASANSLPLEVHYAGGSGGTDGLPAGKDFTTPSGATVHNDGKITWAYLWEQMEKGQNLILMGAGHVVVVEGLLDADQGGGQHMHVLAYRHDPDQGHSTDQDLQDLHFADEVTATDPPALVLDAGKTAPFNVALSESPLPATSALQSKPQSGHVAIQTGPSSDGGCNNQPPSFCTPECSGNLIINPDAIAMLQFGQNIFKGSCNFANGTCNFSGQLGFDIDVGIKMAVQPPVNTSGLTLPFYNGTITLLPFGTDSSCAFPFIGLGVAPSINWGDGTPSIVGDPISAATGELIDDPEPDLSLGGPLPLVFGRHYGSLLAFNGITSTMGNNWRHNFDVKAIATGTQASVITASGEVIRFLPNGSNWNPLSGYKLGYQFVSVSGGYQFLDPASNLVYSFGTDGTLTAITDRNGNKLTVTHGSSGPTQVSDGLGRTLTFTYTSDGHVSKVADQSGRSVSFGFNGSNLISFTDAAGNVTSYSTSGAGQLGGLISRTTLPAGNTKFVQTFDGNGRVATQADGLGNTTSLLYSSTILGNVTVTDPLGNTTTQSHPNLMNFSASQDALGNFTVTNYDSSNRPISVVNRNGDTAKMTYHSPSGYPASFTDFDGNTTTFTYTATSANGFTYYDATKIAYSDGSSVTLAYDANGNLIKQIDAAGKTSSLSVNNRGQVTTMTNGSGGTTAVRYNADGTVAAVTSPASDVTSYTYDALKRVSQVSFADGTSQSFAYDALNRVIKGTDEKSKNTALSYTANGKASSLVDRLGNTTSLAYDAAENLTAIKAPAGTVSVAYNADSLWSSVTAPTSEKRTYSYDQLNRLIGIADSVGPLWSFGRDSEGTVTLMTDGASRIFAIAPDHFGRPLAITSPSNDTWTRSYDKLGRLATLQDPLGNRVSITRDPRGLITGLAYPGGQQSTLARDGLGKITSITDANGGTWARAFDNMGRLTSRTDPVGGVVSFSYNQRNRIASASSSAGGAKFSYDPAGNLVRRLFDDGTELDYTYDDAGRLTGANNSALTLDAAGRVINSNGLQITRDASERITSIAYAPGAVSYSYDQRGMLSQITDWTGAVTAFAYDASLRLVSITRATGVVTQFTYDVNGNLAGIAENASGGALSSISLQRDSAARIVNSNRTLPQAASPAAGVQGYTYDAAHQISGATYDGLGRLTTDPIRSYTWDLASRLASYNGSDGAAAFTYDGFGSRLSRTSNGSTENYVINYGLDLPSVAVAQTGGSDERYYIHLPNGLLLASIEAADNSHHYFHFDENGSTIFLSDDTGSVTDAYGITPFGESVVQIGTTPNLFTWQGALGVMQEPGTSLFYMRARYYDSAPARFVSRDPVSSAAPNAISPYQYAVSNPISFSDPTGLFPHGSSTNFPSLWDFRPGDDAYGTEPLVDPLWGFPLEPPSFLQTSPSVFNGGGIPIFPILPIGQPIFNPQILANPLAVDPTAISPPFFLPQIDGGDSFVPTLPGGFVAQLQVPDTFHISLNGNLFLNPSLPSILNHAPVFTPPPAFPQITFPNSAPFPTIVPINPGGVLFQPGVPLTGPTPFAVEAVTQSKVRF